MTVHFFNRKGILTAFVLLMCVVAIAGLSSCGTSSGPRTSSSANARVAADPSDDTPVPAVNLTLRGKGQINFVDIVTFSLKEGEVQVFYNSQERRYVMEIRLENGNTYLQKWDEENRISFIDAILTYMVDENRKRLGTNEIRSFTNYDTLEGVTEWTDSVSRRNLSAAPAIDLGYLVKDRKSYFTVTQRDAVVTQSSSTENLRSPRIIFCMDLAQSRQMMELFGGTFYEKPIMVFLGDGVTAGANANADDEDDPSIAYPAVLKELMKISVLNSGVSWESTQDTLARVPYDVLKYDPDIVIINLGLSDFLERIPVQTTSRNIQSIINLLREDGPRRIFLTRFYDEKILKNSWTYWNISEIEQTRLLAEYNTVFNNLARTNNVELITNIWEGLDYDDTIGEDYIYPTAEGQRIMAGNFFRVLRPFLAENNYLK